LAETQTAALVQVWNLLRFTFPTTDYASGLTLKTNLIPLVGFGFINNRRISTSWQRTPVMKQVIYISGFFFATMVIALFYCFYQSSRSSADGDHHLLYHNLKAFI
jgi:hypothetical protein